MGIELVTYKGQTVTPKDDALLQQYTLGQDGFFYGCAVTYTGGNTLHLSSGEGVICGREFKLDDTDLSAALPASGTLLGQVYAHIDLSNEDNPIQLIIETAAELTELTKDDDLNINNGEYDLQICTFTASPSALSDVESTVVYLVKGGGGGSMANAYDSSSPYVIGENFTKDGVYYEVIAPISAGDPLVIDTNVKVTNPGAQITAINQNLMQRPIYNPTDDYLYGYDENGVLKRSVIRLGITKDYIFLNGVWNTDAKEDGAIPIYYGNSQAYNNAGGVQVADGLIKLNSQNLSNGYARNTQVRIDNDGRKIIIKYKTSDSPTAQVQTMEINNGYTSTYLLLLDTAWNGIAVNTDYAWSNTRYNSYTLVYNAGGSYKYITEIYVEPAS